MSEKCRCQHAAKNHEYGVGRCRCGCPWFATGEKFQQVLAKQRRDRGDCVACPEQNPDCQHPTCPRFPQPGHLELEVNRDHDACQTALKDLALRLKSIRDLAEDARDDGGMISPHVVLSLMAGD